MGKAHRLGQEKVVNVHRLIMRETLEEQVMSKERFEVSVANAANNLRYEYRSVAWFICISRNPQEGMNTCCLVFSKCRNAECYYFTMTANGFENGELASLTCVVYAIIYMYVCPGNLRFQKDYCVPPTKCWFEWKGLRFHMVLGLIQILVYETTLLGAVPTLVCDSTLRD